MIKLDIQPYCENCPAFSPETEVNKLFGAALDDEERPMIVETRVYCSKAPLCRGIYGYLKKQL